LDRNKYEVWYLSNNGLPKDWYRIDKFFSELPHEHVIQIYEQCDILLKSSWKKSYLVGTATMNLVAIGTTKNPASQGEAS